MALLGPWNLQPASDLSHFTTAPKHLQQDGDAFVLVVVYYIMQYVNQCMGDKVRLSC